MKRGFPGEITLSSAQNAQHELKSKETISISIKLKLVVMNIINTTIL
jgi:hypothetical protein